MRVECSNMHELAALADMIEVLELVKYASKSIGAERNPTIPMEETLYLYVRREDVPTKRYSDALSALKDKVLRDMHTHRGAERRGRQNPD